MSEKRGLGAEGRHAVVNALEHMAGIKVGEARR